MKRKNEILNLSINGQIAFTYGVSFATQTLNTLGLAIRGVQSVAFRNLTVKSNEKIKGNE